MRTARVVATAVGLLLLIATGIAAVVGARADAQHRATATADVRRAATRALHSQLDEVVNQTTDLGGLIVSSHDVSEEEFTRFTRPLLRSGTASSFGWVQRVPGSQRRAFERRTGLRIRALAGPGPAPQRSSYDVITRISSLAPEPTRALGLDVGSERVRRETLDRAAAQQEPQATPVTRLAVTGRLGIAVYAPVMRPDGALAGVALGTFRTDGLSEDIGAVLPARAGFRLEQDGTTVAHTGTLGADPDRWNVSIAGRSWVVVSSPPPAGRLGSAGIALLVGGLLTALVVLALLGLAREAGRARELAEDRERERDIADGDRRTMERRFSGAFDGAPVGMALVDADGRCESVNQALADLLGRTRDELDGTELSATLAGSAAAGIETTVRELADGTRAAFGCDVRLAHASGDELTAAIRMTALENGPGERRSIFVHVDDVTEQRSAERQMAHLAHHDALTGLLNRRGLARDLGRQLAHARRYGTAGAVLLLDLDRFKAVNDRHGHEEGDRLLRAIADGLRTSLRATDVIARLGGDELAIVLPGETPQEAGHVAAKVVACVREAARSAGHDVTASVGVAPLRDGQADGDEILREADAAMYGAKAAGGDCHVVAPSRAAAVAADG